MTHSVSDPKDPSSSGKLHRWLTLGANVGVLLGLFFLVAELRHNAAMMRAQTRNELITRAFFRYWENVHYGRLPPRTMAPPQRKCRALPG